MSRYDTPYYNSEKYYDPTAGAALINTIKEARKQRQIEPETVKAEEPTINEFLDWYEPNLRCKPEKIASKRRRIAKDLKIYDFCMEHCMKDWFTVEAVTSRFRCGEKVVEQIFSGTGYVTKYVKAWERFRKERTR